MIDLRLACRAVDEVTVGLTPAHMDLPTPCPEYSVGGLVDHVQSVTTLYLLIATWDSDEAVAPPSAPVVHRSPGWRNSLGDRLDALAEAWADPEAWAGRTNLAGLELANQQWGGIAATELVVHGWDLATATGQHLDLPEPTLRGVLDHVSAFVPTAPVPGLFAAPVGVSPDAPLLDRIVAVTGRTP